MYARIVNNRKHGRKGAAISFKLLAYMRGLRRRARSAKCKEIFLILRQERAFRLFRRQSVRGPEVFPRLKIKRDVGRVLRLFTAKGMPPWIL